MSDADRSQAERGASRRRDHQRIDVAASVTPAEKSHRMLLVEVGHLLVDLLHELQKASDADRA